MAKRTSEGEASPHKRGGGKDVDMPSDYWASDPSLSYLTGLSLDNETKLAIENVWNILDTNKDFKLTAEDWALVPGGGSKWELLRSKFDLNGDTQVEPQEFILKLKDMALALPLDPSCFPGTPSSHMECCSWLNKSACISIQSLCKDLITEVNRKDSEIYLQPETVRQISMLWDVLDVNKDGDLTHEDFLFDKGGSDKWAKLEAMCAASLHTRAASALVFVPVCLLTTIFRCTRSMRSFDFDKSGSISPDEFRDGLKNLALKEPIEMHCFQTNPKNHIDMMRAINDSTNRQVQNLCKTLFESLKG